MFTVPIKSVGKIENCLYSILCWAHFSFWQELKKQEHLEPLTTELKDKLDELAAGIHDEKLPELVLQAEYHAAELNDSSGILDGWDNLTVYIDTCILINVQTCFRECTQTKIWCQVKEGDIVRYDQQKTLWDSS